MGNGQHPPPQSQRSSNWILLEFGVLGLGRAVPLFEPFLSQSGLSSPPSANSSFLKLIPALFISCYSRWKSRYHSNVIGSTT
eukprot:6088060-Amphidinium_carterae.1